MRIHSTLLALSIAFAGCRGADPADPDEDGDGYPASVDCDDSDASVHPDAEELCNGVDDDCDGAIDEDATDAPTWYADEDADGWGDPDASVVACEAPAAHIAAAGDCDDRRADANPDAAEVCDGIDNDCDGDVDEAGATGETTWYADGDGDGYGDAASPLTGCTAPAGYVADATDCDDTAAAARPGGVEVCDGLDNDCDGEVDEAAALDALTWYADADSDGFGKADASARACTQPEGHVADASDCDDTRADVYPGAVEVCNSVDDDCDGQVDEPDAADASTWYGDADGDGYGGTLTAVACAAPTGYVADGGDCDDSDDDSHPGATEICDGKDNDCNGVVDDPGAVGEKTFYIDADGDGHGGLTSKLACFAPSGYVAASDDCDDSDKGIFPGATEVCDAKDNDCDGLVDEAGAIGEKTFYVDADGDGHGGEAILACVQPDGTTLTSTDCDDDDPEINPDADEVCDDDGVDEDCDPSTLPDCRKTVFVSSAIYDGNMGGLAGADAKCQALADAAGLYGKYKAWLSTPSDSPSTTFKQSSEPYILFDGTKIANNWADLVDGTLAAAINMTEKGGVTPTTSPPGFCGGPPPVWSATAPNGASNAGSSSCSGWTSTSGGSQWGLATATNSSWSSWCSGGSCAWLVPIYCFQQ